MPGIKIETKGIRSMRKVPVLAQLSILGMLSIASAPWAVADSVRATDDIYAAGNQSALLTSDGGGTAPNYIDVSSGVTWFTFSVSISAPITLNSGGGGYQCNGCSTGNGTDYNDADGLSPSLNTYGPNATSSNTGYESISGITAPGVGYLVGVFIEANTFSPSGAAPSPLNFTGSDVSGYTTVAGGTDFTTLRPALDQVFFIGDGLTGDGRMQRFVVPTNTTPTKLYLGISDARGYQGSPSYYGDNSGSFDVTATGQGRSPFGPRNEEIAPEPSSLLLLGTGILGMAGMLRRKLLVK